MTEATQQSADSATARMLALMAAWQAGQIDAPDMARGAAVATYAAKVLASRYADIAVSTLAHRPPLGIRPGEQHLDRLAEAVETVLEADEDPAPALERLAQAETLASGQLSSSSAIRQHGFPGFREVVAPDACEICRPYADRLHEAEDNWQPHHPRCRCELVPEGEPAPLPEITEPIRPTIRITRVLA